MTRLLHAETYLASQLRLAWCGPSLLVLDLGGGCGRHSLSGLLFREARHLSTLRLELFGEEPNLASMAQASPRRLESTFLHPPVGELSPGLLESTAHGRPHRRADRGLPPALAGGEGGRRGAAGSDGGGLITPRIELISFSRAYMGVPISRLKSSTDFSPPRP